MGREAMTGDVDRDAEANPRRGGGIGSPGFPKYSPASYSSKGRVDIREARLAAGYTQAALSEKVGASHNHLGKVERGETPPSRRVARGIEEALGRSSGSLFAEKDLGHRGSEVRVDPDPRTLAGRLLSVRRDSGLDRLELAELSGLSDAAIALIERSGCRLIRPETAYKLERALGLDAGYFEPYVGGPQSPPGGRYRPPIARRITAARVEAGLTMDEISRITGLRRGSYTNIEAGLATPSAEAAAAIEKVLSLKRGEILGPEGFDAIPGIHDKHSREAVRRLRERRDEWGWEPLEFAEKVLLLRVDADVPRREAARRAAITAPLLARIEGAAIEANCGEPNSGGADSAEPNGEPKVDPRGSTFRAQGNPEAVASLSPLSLAALTDKRAASRAADVRKIAYAFGVEPLWLSGDARVGDAADMLLDLRVYGGPSGEPYASSGSAPPDAPSFRAMARYTGVHEQYLMEYENDYRPPTAENARILGAFYGVEPREIYAAGYRDLDRERSERRERRDSEADVEDSDVPRPAVLLEAARHLRDARVRAVISERELARKVSIPDRAVAKLERAQRPPLSSRALATSIGAIEDRLGMAEGTLEPLRFRESGAAGDFATEEAFTSEPSSPVQEHSDSSSEIMGKVLEGKPEEVLTEVLAEHSPVEGHTLALRIKQARVAQAMSQSALSTLSGVSVPTLSSIERDAETPKPLTVCKLALALEVDARLLEPQLGYLLSPLYRRILEHCAREGIPLRDFAKRCGMGTEYLKRLACGLSPSSLGSSAEMKRVERELDG